MAISNNWFHGTSQEAAEAIRKSGVITPQQEKRFEGRPGYIYLTNNEVIASMVAGRTGAVFQVEQPDPALMVPDEDAIYHALGRDTGIGVHWWNEAASKAVRAIKRQLGAKATVIQIADHISEHEPNLAKLLIRLENTAAYRGSLKVVGETGLNKESRLSPALKRGTSMAFDDAELLAKTARVLCESDIPNSNPELQALVGDPDDYRSSPFAQYKPNPGNMQLPNPLSPVEGDEMFFAYMIPGAKFQAKDGSQWNVLDYPWQGMVHIENVWYPRVNAQVNLNDIRRSIEQWVEPVQVFVAAPAPGVDYGAMPVKIVDGPTNYGRPDELSKGEMGHGNSDVAGGW